MVTAIIRTNSMNMINDYGRAARAALAQRRRLSELARRVRQQHERITLTCNGEPEAILVSSGRPGGLEMTVPEAPRSSGLSSRQHGEGAQAETSSEPGYTDSKIRFRGRSRFRTYEPLACKAKTAHNKVQLTESASYA